MAKASQKRSVNFEDFDLAKFKTIKDETSVIYYDTGNPKVGKQTAKLKDKIHDDLVGRLGNLKLYFATRLGLVDVTDTIRDEYKDNPELLKRAIELHKEQVDRCSVTGIAFSGEKQLRGVQITGKVKVPGYGSFSLACPKIIFASDSLGYETEVEELCEEVKKEVYNHTFKGKRAPKPSDNQKTIDDAIDEAENSK